MRCNSYHAKAARRSAAAARSTQIPSRVTAGQTMRCNSGTSAFHVSGGLRSSGNQCLRSRTHDEGEFRLSVDQGNHCVHVLYLWICGSSLDTRSMVARRRLARQFWLAGAHVRWAGAATPACCCRVSIRWAAVPERLNEQTATHPNSYSIRPSRCDRLKQHSPSRAGKGLGGGSN